MSFASNAGVPSNSGIYYDVIGVLTLFYNFQGESFSTSFKLFSAALIYSKLVRVQHLISPNYFSSNRAPKYISGGSILSFLNFILPPFNSFNTALESIDTTKISPT